MSDRQNRSATRQALKQKVIKVDATQHQIGSQRPLSAACDLRLVVESRPPAVRPRILSKRRRPGQQHSGAIVNSVGHDMAPAFMLNAEAILDFGDVDVAVDVPTGTIPFATEAGRCVSPFRSLWTGLPRGGNVLVGVGAASATVGGNVGSFAGSDTSDGTDCDVGGEVVLSHTRRRPLDTAEYRYGRNTVPADGVGAALEA